MFKALVLDKSEGFAATVREVDDSFLPDGDVTVAIDYSTLNYKDGLAITNRSPVVRSWPMVAGIDGAGTVSASTHAAWKVGDAVVLNGFGVGETHKGCLAQRARLKGDWLVRRPDAFSARQAMAIGTAGYTAMLCVLALETHGLTPAAGDVLVAAAVIDRAELGAQGKPLQKERWAAVVDAVGSHTLANACAQTRYGGAVAACGLAQGIDLPATVMPFILRGVALLGVDSVMAPMRAREQAWARLAVDLDPAVLEAITTEVPLSAAIAAAGQLMAGQVRGRLVVDTAR